MSSVDPSASNNIASSLASIEKRTAPQTARAQYYINLLNQIQIPSAPEDATCTADFKSVFSSALNSMPALSLVTLRPFLEAFIALLNTVPSSSIRVAAGTHALEILSTRPSGTYEDVSASLRELLAGAYEQQEEFLQSAQLLSQINLESSLRQVSDSYKFNIFLRIIRCYIEEDESIQASAYVSRAKNLLYKIHDPVAKLQFALCEARILDALRDFLPAADRYLSVSLSPSLDPDERLMALSSSITCAVLAPAGPNRSRTLSRLYRDERSQSLPQTLFSILEKMHLDRPLDPADIAAFKDLVKPHHLAITAEGVTVLDKAVIEHNLLATSKLYNNISFTALGAILGVDEEKASEYAEGMVQQERLRGRMDQIEGVIYFEAESENKGEGLINKKEDGGVGMGRASTLRVWERNVRGVVEEVERVIGLVGEEFPAWVEREMGKAH